MVQTIFNRASASIILKSKFETGKSGKKNHMAELQKFVDYIARQEALRKDKQEFTLNSEELEELNRIEVALEKMEDETTQPVIKDIQQMDRYIDYMTRKKAILENTDNEIVNGAFSYNKRFINKKDVKEIKKNVIEAKNNNSVMFQDVISFKNDFLEEHGYFNSKTGELNENILYEATKNMMDKLKKKEGLIEPFWFATIHRNTEHIHLHITCMERKNTREMMEFDGVLQARGKRKQSTLDDMIFAFGSKILDRTNEFEKLSKLRKEVPLEIKDTVKDCLIQMYVTNSKNEKIEFNNPEIEKYLKELKSDIPLNVRGYKELPKETQSKIDKLTEYLTKDNPKRKEYDSVTKEIDELYQKTYGKRYEPNKFYENRKADFNARMGNAVVTQIKNIKKAELNNDINKFVKDNKLKLSFKYDKSKLDLKTDFGKNQYNSFEKSLKEKQEAFKQKEQLYQKKKNQFADRKDLMIISRAINDDLKMYRAKKDFERLQAQIEQDKLRQAYELGM